MNDFSAFTRQFPVQKTLRFELIPTGKTAENLRNSKFFEDDENRSKNYVKVKALVDDFHRRFINESLADCEIDWSNLSKAHEERKKNENDLKSVSNLESIARKYRQLIRNQFTGEPGKENPILTEYGIEFKDLFSEKLFSKVLSIDAEKSNSVEDKNALDTFDKFSGYFIGLHENRRNFYAAEKQITSAISRIVDDNFPKYCNNCSKFNALLEEHPDIVEELTAELGKDPKPYFQIENYNRFITQKGINEYNDVIGGHFVQGNEKKVQGINEILNLKHQQNPEFKLQMTHLYNQILGGAEGYSYIPKQFDNDSELIDSLNDLIKKIDDTGSLETLCSTIGNLENYNPSGIFISQSELALFSRLAFGRWDRAEDLLRKWRANELGNPNLENSEKVDKWIKSPEFSLKTIIEASEFGETKIDYAEFHRKFEEIEKEASGNISKTESLRGERILGNEANSEKVKSILDLYIEAIKIARIFRADEDLPRDEKFYSDFDQSFQTISETNVLYNKARNFCTKKPYNEKKFKLNFGNQNLADGWSITKEMADTAVILRKNGLYYLCVMNPSAKTDFSKLPMEGDSGYYEKMNYMQIPDPSKMLPKVLMPSKSQGPHPASDYIKEGYSAGKHKLGDNFDLKFCRDLIDYYKEGIKCYPTWSGFDFKFKPTEEYANIKEFYSDVERCGYKISFIHVSKSAVDKLVDEGKLYLFKIYNKDFSPDSKGTPNMHTLYFRAAFSEENLRSPVIKLNGNAELFFRKKSESMNKIVHKKGTIIINRTYRDSNGVVKSIPNSAYYEIFRFKTGQISKLSPEAEKYLNLVQSKTANRDLVKDRRYLEDRIFFHVPLTFNFTADNNALSLNKKIIDWALSDKDLRIIGIDRGERNLLYYVMTDRSGNILEQRSLNEICHIDYHEKLVQRENERTLARQNWTQIGKITDLKDGYLSQVISFLADRVVKEHAIIVLEDLNYGFKRGRFKFERQVYQKFENMLISKLSHLVFKNTEDGLSPGGVLNAYQLARPPESVKSNQRQNGVIFYIPAAYTSKIDPTTGFVNLFKSEPASVKGRKEFIENLNSIRYDSIEDCFVFEFDYRKFAVNKDLKNVWKAYSLGERIIYNRTDHTYSKVRPTEELKKDLKEAGIPLEGDLKDAIAKSDKSVRSALRALRLTLQMRNEDENEDYIISPIRNSNGEFFCTKNGMKGLPLDSDANGAYHIALKGELMLRMMADSYLGDDSKPNIPFVGDKEWLTFVQSGMETWKNRSRYRTSTISASARHRFTITILCRGERTSNSNAAIR